jgi:type IV pilus assembly protein PilN
MRISVNLATRPFIELRPLFARLRLAMGVLALLVVGLGFWLHALNAKAAVAQAKMDALKTKTMRFQQERSSNEARMRQPQNMAVLERSQFLNAVFARKSFSWTSVMMDLERVLPAGVQVTSIDPVITKEGDVNIRLRVTGDRERTVLLVRNLETSQRFVAPRLAGEQALTAEGNQGTRGVAVQPVVPGGVVFEILSGYNPLPLTTAKAEKSEGKDAGNGTGAEAAGAAKKTVTKRARAKTGVAPAAGPGVSKGSAAKTAKTPKGGAR